MPMAKDLEYYLAQARRIAEHREVGAERELRKLYKAMLKDLQQFLSETYIQYAEDDKLTYAMLQKAGYDARFLEEVEQRLNLATPAAAKQLRELVEETYRAAYESMIDGVRRAVGGETLDAAFAETVAITPEQIKAAVENPVSGLKLSDTLEKNRREIIYSIKQSVGIGLMIGARYTTIARRIAEQVDGDYKKAVRIARTEAHRVREAGNHDAAMGVDRALQNGTTGWRMVKRWKTMQDERVRPQRRRKGKKGWRTTMGRGANHMKLHGQTVLEDEPFDLGGGVTAMAPGQSGVAGHDINCRCIALREMMDDAEFFEKTGRHFKGHLTNEQNDDMNEQKDAIPLSTYFNSSEPIYAAAKKVKAIDGYEDIFIHGGSTGFSINDANGDEIDWYTPREFAEILREDPNYHGGDIRLCSCGTGAQDAIAAAALAKQLKVNVLAPSNTLWILRDGEMTIGESPAVDDGEWVLFKGRE